MKTEFAKAIEAGEDVVGKEVVCLVGHKFNDCFYETGSIFTITGTSWTPEYTSVRWVKLNGKSHYPDQAGTWFEFKHVLDKQEVESVSYKLLSEQNKLLEAMLEGAKTRNKQYEQQIQMLKDDLFNLQMENARLDLAAQRWEMFNCEANRNIADKLLKKLADDAVETR